MSSIHMVRYERVEKTKAYLYNNYEYVDNKRGTYIFAYQCTTKAGPKVHVYHEPHVVRRRHWNTKNRTYKCLKEEKEISSSK